MYTATLVSDVINKEIQRRIVTVSFSDGVTQYEKPFQFNIGIDTVIVKRTVKQYLDEINFVPVALTGTIDDYVEPDNSARLAWLEDRDKLSQLMRLVADGVFTGNETQITNLQTKVRNTFDVSFLN